MRLWRESKYIQAGAEMFRAERPFKGEAGEQMAEPLLPHIWATVANGKADGYTAAVQSFVWLLDYFLKWTYQDAMWSENEGSRRGDVYQIRNAQTWTGTMYSLKME